MPKPAPASGAINTGMLTMNGNCNDNDVWIQDEVFDAGGGGRGGAVFAAAGTGGLFTKLGLKDDQLQKAVQQGHASQNEKGRSLTDELVHESTERGPDQGTQ